MSEKYNFINLEYLESMIAGDKEMKSIIIQNLLEEPLQAIQKMKIFLAEENWEEFHQISHK